ncbi:DUF4178 domain-containing protein [Zavarzinia sp. CC-PAN008]|uniref:DUF4178 domain-containing protein n=1 Tax=Zavarzinia sp. CC-PAN008 TaxID=3243332 RepID=UPI003F74AA8B
MANPSCPSCGAEVPLRSAALPYATCAYCQAVLVRQDEGLREVGRTAILPADVSPIQLTTTGHADGLAFTVVGRVRWGWRDGSWNEWLLEMADGSSRWLGEAMGLFMVTAERPELLDLPLLATFRHGGGLIRDAVVTIDGRSFVASDLKEAQCLGSEGQLGFPSPRGRAMTSIDFRDAVGGLLSLQRDQDGARAWFGHYCTLAELRPANLRQLDGWRMPAALR